MKDAVKGCTNTETCRLLKKLSHVTKSATSLSASAIWLSIDRAKLTWCSAVALAKSARSLSSLLAELRRDKNISSVKHLKSISLRLG